MGIVNSDDPVKPFSDLTDEQLIEIATLAAESIINMDLVVRRINQPKSSPIKFLVNKEKWNEEEGREFTVARILLHGLGDTHCAIWEVVAPNYIDVSMVHDNEIVDVDNQTQIFKKLIEWGFV